MRGGDDISVANEGATALELHVRPPRDDVAEVGQPRKLPELRVLKSRLLCVSFCVIRLPSEERGRHGSYFSSSRSHSHLSADDAL